MPDDAPADGPTPSSTPSSPDAASTGSRWGTAATWGGGILGTLLVLVLAVVLLLPTLFPPERLKEFVVPRMEEAVGREVTIEGIGLRVLPAPAVRVSNFAIANAEGYGGEPAVSGRALNVDVSLWPLFTGRIVPTAVELVEPTVRYQVGPDGATNFDTFGGAADTTAADEEGASFDVAVSNFRMTGARVVYDDQSTGQALDLALDARLSASLEGGAVASTGTVDLASIRALLPDVAEDTVALQNARVDYDVLLAADGGRLDLRQLDLQTAPLTIRVSGGLVNLNGRPAADLQFETTETDLTQVLDVIPGDPAPGVNPQGTLRLSGRITGPLAEGEEAADDAGALAVQADGRLDGFGVDYEGAPLLRDVGADLALSLDSASVRGLRGTLLGRPLEGQVAVADLSGDPRLSGRLNGAADLAELATLAEADAGDLAGTADFDVRFDGPAMRPDAIRLEGPIRLADVRLPNETLREPLEIPEAALQLTGTGVSTDDIAMRSGENAWTLQADVRSLFPISKGLAETNPAARVSFELTSDKIDLVTLYPEADTTEPTYADLVTAQLAGAQVNGRSPEAVAEEVYGGTELPAIGATGRVEIATLLNPPQRFDDLTLDVALQNRRLALNDIQARTYGGQMAGSVVIDQSPSAGTAGGVAGGERVLLAAAASEAPRVAPRRRRAPAPTDLTYDLELTDIQASAFLEDWTRLGRAVSGTLDLRLDGESPLSEGFLPLADALRASGRSVVADGGFSSNLRLPTALIDRLGLKAPSLRQFRSFGGPFQIENGELKIGTWPLANESLDGELTGAFGLGGTVDLTLGLEVPVAALSESKIPGMVEVGRGLQAALKQLSGQGRTVPVQIAVGGTISSPELQVDTGSLRSALQQLAKEAGKNTLRNLFDRGGGGGQ